MAVQRHISAYLTSSSLQISPFNPEFPYKNAGKFALFKNILLILPSELVQNDVRNCRADISEGKRKKVNEAEAIARNETFDQTPQ